MSSERMLQEFRLTLRGSTECISSSALGGAIFTLGQKDFSRSRSYAERSNSLKGSCDSDVANDVADVEDAAWAEAEDAGVVRVVKVGGDGGRGLEHGTVTLLAVCGPAAGTVLRSRSSREVKLHEVCLSEDIRLSVLASGARRDEIGPGGSPYDGSSKARQGPGVVSMGSSRGGTRPFSWLLVGRPYNVSPLNMDLESHELSILAGAET